MHIDRKDILSAVSDELVARIIGSVFIRLGETVPASPMPRIRAIVDRVLSRVDITQGTMFSMAVSAVAAYWDGSKGVVENVDGAIAALDHVRYQISSIAATLQPIVVQTIRLVDTFQKEAESTLFTLQEKITADIAADETERNFTITPISLGILDDAEKLADAAIYTDQSLPHPDALYLRHEYKAFAHRYEMYTLTTDQRAEMAKILLDNKIISEDFSSLVMGASTDHYFPDQVRGFKGHADALTDLWDNAYALKTSTEGEDLPHEIKTNIDSLLHRAALAVHWGRRLIEDDAKRTLIAGHTASQIYVYPVAYKLYQDKHNNSAEGDAALTDYVRARRALKQTTPVAGYTSEDVLTSKESTKNILARFRQNALLNQRKDTKEVITRVCRETLTSFPPHVGDAVIKDLSENSGTALQILLTAYVERAKNYYLTTMTEAIESEEFSSGIESETRSNTIILFLAIVSRDKIVSVPTPR